MVPVFLQNPYNVIVQRIRRSKTDWTFGNRTTTITVQNLLMSIVITILEKHNIFKTMLTNAYILIVLNLTGLQQVLLNKTRSDVNIY